MEKKSSITTMDMFRVALAIGTLIIVFVVSARAERQAKERDEAARKNLEQQIEQVYQVLQLTISRTESCAVETDRAGNVLWMNALARKRLRLCIGENVISCMTADGSKQHTAGFARAMETVQTVRTPLSVIPECMAITRDGEQIKVSVETWRTPNGAMAFVTELRPNTSRMTSSADK